LNAAATEAEATIGHGPPAAEPGIGTSAALLLRAAAFGVGPTGDRGVALDIEFNVEFVLLAAVAALEATTELEAAPAAELTATEDEEDEDEDEDER
jgi:hypothetical protein